MLLEHKDWISFSAPSRYIVRATLEFNDGEQLYGVRVFDTAHEAENFQQQMRSDPRRHPKNKEEGLAYFTEVMGLE